MSGYSTDQTWRKTQGFLPEPYRLKEDEVPEEYFLPIQALEVHVDHYQSIRPRARIIIFHGVGGNGRLPSAIALLLARQGYEVICPDLPLYGYTRYKNPVTYQTWIDCGVALVNHYQQQRPDCPTFLFGLSAGGMLAYQVACECVNITGLLATCLLDQRDLTVTKATARHPLVATVGKPLMGRTYRMLGNFKIPMKVIGNMKAIVNNEALAGMLMKDKKSSGASVPLAFAYTMLTPEIKIEPEDFRRCPFLLVHPEDDRWTDIKLSRRFFDRLPGQKQICMLTGAGHFPIEKEGLEQMERCCVSFIEALIA